MIKNNEELKVGDIVSVKLEGIVISADYDSSPETYPTIEICFNRAFSKGRILYTCLNDKTCEIERMKK